MLQITADISCCFQSPMPTVKTSLSLCLTKRMLPKEFSYFLRNIRLRLQIREPILTLVLRTLDGKSAEASIAIHYVAGDGTTPDAVEATR